MDRFRFRRWAKIIAVLECTIATFSFLLLPFYFRAAFFVSYHDDGSHRLNKYLHYFAPVEKFKADWRQLWTVIVVLTIHVNLSAMEAYNLLKATAKDNIAEQALKQAISSRTIRIWHTLWGILYWATYLQVFPFVGLICLNVLPLFVVHKYVNELEAANNGEAIVEIDIQHYPLPPKYSDKHRNVDALIESDLEKANNPKLVDSSI